MVAAAESSASIYTVERIERGTGISDAAMAKGVAAIKAALEAEGIEFIDDANVPGVRLHLKKRKRK